VRIKLQQVEHLQFNFQHLHRRQLY